MKETFKVVMLPTEKASPLMMDLDGGPPILQYAKNYGFDEFDHLKNFAHTNKQHLYILSDDEIKEGDWYCSTLSKSIHQAFGNGDYNRTSKGLYKKIVATTDKSLKIGGGTGRREDGISIPLPQLPESFIPVYIKTYNEGKPITEVDLEVIKCCGRCDDIHDECQGDILKTTPNNEVVVCYKKEPVIGLYTKIHVARLCLKMQHDYSKFKESCHYGPNMREIAEWTDKWLEENL